MKIPSHNVTGSTTTAPLITSAMDPQECQSIADALASLERGLNQTRTPIGPISEYLTFAHKHFGRLSVQSALNDIAIHPDTTGLGNLHGLRPCEQVGGRHVMLHILRRVHSLVGLEPIRVAAVSVGLVPPVVPSN